jgi:hypothetical protein
MIYLARACLAASAFSCFTLGPAAAQYNIFNGPDGLVTDVIINGRPEALASVRQFEERCKTHVAAGRWWLDFRTGNSGPEGGPATYNAITCQPLTGQTNSTGAAKPQTEMTCTFYKGGSVCRDSRDISVNSNGR